MNIGFHQVKQSQAENRAILAEGVKGVKCMYSGSKAGLPELNEEQVLCMASVENTLMRTYLHEGTVELYDNGAINIFVRDPREVVIGYVTIRP